MAVASLFPIDLYSVVHQASAAEDRTHGPLFDLLTGTPGEDVLVGTNGDDTLNGLAGADTLMGRGRDDRLDGGDQDDYIRGDPGNDTLFGGDGNDYLRGGAGDDVVDGGAGLNRAAFFDSTVGVRVSLLLQGAVQDTGQGMDLLTKIQHLSGTRFADLLSGDSGDNWLWGDVSGANPGTGGGNDTLIGNDGNDLLEVGTGDNVLAGLRGTDTASVFGGGSDTLGGVTLDLNIQLGFAQDTTQGTMYLRGVENLSGSIHDDTFTGNGHANLLAGDAGNDTLNGGGRNDTLFGDGDVRVDTGATGASGAIVTERQRINPDSSPAGADVLNGEGGADRLFGGLGADTMTGGAGADVFEYRVVEDSAPGASDFITDFRLNDRVNLKDIDADISTETNEGFHFVTGFSGAAAEAWLHYDRTAGLTYLELDVNGDAQADAVIKFDGRITTAYDFEL
jgi:Ca2+-binding RTX toxin-like protein